MMYLKIMGSENQPDHDQSKPHTLLSVRSYTTGMGVEGPPALFIYGTTLDGGDFHQRVFSNIYVMNSEGKTINTISPLPGPPSPQ